MQHNLTAGLLSRLLFWLLFFNCSLRVDHRQAKMRNAGSLVCKFYLRNRTSCSAISTLPRGNAYRSRIIRARSIIGPTGAGAHSTGGDAKGNGAGARAMIAGQKCFDVCRGGYNQELHRLELKMNADAGGCPPCSDGTPAVWWTGESRQGGNVNDRYEEKR